MESNTKLEEWDFVSVESTVNFTIETELRISKGDYHLPMMYLLKTDKDRKIVLSAEKGRFPDAISTEVNFVVDKGYSWRVVSDEVYSLLAEAIKCRKKSYKYLDNFTFLYTYCLSKGVDLFECGVLQK